MCNPAVSFSRFFLVVALVIFGSASLWAQTSNRLWFVTYNGEPTPSSDVSVRSVVTDGSATALATGAASSFVSQTNFPSFDSPFDVAVDPAMGKVYVVDNRLSSGTPTNQCIYSFNLTGSPAQIAASAKVIYTVPVPAADTNAGLYPLIYSLALDPSSHLLYFNQFDATTATNSFIGRLDLVTSSNSDVFASVGGNPALQTFFAGQLPGFGQMAIDATNIYLGAHDKIGNSGVYAAPRDGTGAFAELVTVSTNNISFTNGYVTGVASDPRDHLVYYLTVNAGYDNLNFDTNQNALWVYDTETRSRKKISSGYPAYPDNLAVDPVNHRYYFTLGKEGTTAAPQPQSNDQAVYTGTLASTNPPSLLYLPSLSDQDAANYPGRVAVQGIYVETAPSVAAVSDALYPAGGGPVTLAPNLVVTDPSSTMIAGATVAITNGGFAEDGDVLAVVTNGTGIAATFNAATETMTLSGNDTLANYQQVLRTVAFSSTNSDPSLGGLHSYRTLAWTVTNDGLSSSTPAVLTVFATPAPPTNQMAITGAPGNWTILYTGAPDTNYVVQSAEFVQGPWSDLSPVLTANSIGFIAYNDPSNPLPKTRFYRVRPK